MENITKKGTPKDVFLHLLSTITLYVSVVAFITLWWQYVNVLFPDQLGYNYYGSYYTYAYDPIRWAMSTLIVVWPIYILISWLIGREFKQDPEKREIKSRKWLWYITLFASAVTIIIDLISLIFNFLKGELSTQFFLKVLVILIVAAGVFGYYLWDLRKRDHKSNKPRLFAWIVSAIILVSIVYGFILIGSPTAQRARRFDEQRVNDLSIIQSEIINYWQNKNSLPANLNQLNDSIRGFISPTDPETNKTYEYIRSGQLSFSLCSYFKTKNKSVLSDKSLTPVMYKQQNWDHEDSYTCFERVIDPELYPKNNIIPITRPVY
ncbi:MAG TPA: DUF5671 domain-containing protein [Candidatus Paceibacterota bacterium]